MNFSFDSFIAGIKNVFSVIMTLITALFGLASGGKTTYKPVDADQLIMSGVIISDTHITQSSSDSTKILEKGLKDMNKGEAGLGFLVIAGDLTDKGTTQDYSKFFSTLSSKSKAEKTIAAVGNHDLRQGEQSIKDFTEKYSSFSGKKITKPYYSTTVNGYGFISIGSEKPLQNEAYLSETQLKWVDSQLKKMTEANDKPIFLICHQPLNGTNRVSDAWPPGVLGEQSDKLRDIIKKYTDNGTTVLLISGHLHSGFGYTKQTHENGLYYIDLPSFGIKPSRGNVVETGTGLVAEIYPDRILLRARNFTSGKFYERYDYEIPVEKHTSPLTPVN